MKPKKIERLVSRLNELIDDLNAGPDIENPDKQAFPLRLRRAVSWLHRANQVDKKDLDTQFVFLWIGFNALYARDPRRFVGGQQPSQRKDAKKYFTNLSKFGKDTDGRICKAVSQKEVNKAVIGLLKNKYVSTAFWEHRHKNPKSEQENPRNWSKSQKRKMKSYESAKEKQNSRKMLSIIFGRLFTLRNQMMHGGSTWNSELSDGQLRDGAVILHCLLPEFIDIMLDGPDDKWGEVHYPRLSGRPIEPLNLT